MAKRWTVHEKQFIIDNADKLHDEEIAEQLTKLSGRVISLDAVRKQRQKMGLSKKPGRGKCEVK